MALIEMNVGAARRFYQLAAGHLSPPQTVQFILSLHQTLKHCITEGGKGDGHLDSKRKKGGPMSEGEETHQTTDESQEQLMNHSTDSKHTVFQQIGSRYVVCGSW